VSTYTPLTKISEFDITGDSDNDFRILALLNWEPRFEETKAILKTCLPKFEVTCTRSRGPFLSMLNTEYDSIIIPFKLEKTVATTLAPIIEIILYQSQDMYYGPAIFFFVYKDQGGNLQVSIIHTEYGGIHYKILAFLQKCIDDSVEMIFFSILKHDSSRIMAFGGQEIYEFWEVFLKTVLA
jgi:hypothetical protein